MDYLLTAIPILIMALSFIEYVSGSINDAIYVAMLGLAGILIVIIALLIDIRNHFELLHQKDK